MRIGVDVGGTKISAVLYDKKVIKKIKIKTPKTKKEFISSLKKIIKELDNGKVEHIGIAIPGFTNGKKIVRCKNLQFLNNTNLSKELKRNVVLLNDANAFSVAEAKYGAAKGKKHVVGLIIGTGVGSGLVLNGELYSGSDFRAGEGGHIWITPFSDETNETQWSGPALEKMYEELTGKKKTLKEIYKLKSDEAKMVISYAIEGIAYMCSIWTWMFNPEVIVIGGGVSNLPIYKEVNKKLAKFYRGKPPKVLKNKLGDDAGVIGAALA